MIGRMARLALTLLALGLAAPAAAQKPILPDFHADPSATRSRPPTSWTGPTTG
jgi:hypothetical protein